MPPSSIIVQVIGAPKVIARLTVAQRNLTYNTVTATREAGQMYLAAIKSYPASRYTDDWKNRVATFFPYRPPQKKNSYERTGALQKSWRGSIKRGPKGVGGAKGGGTVMYVINQKKIKNKKSKVSVLVYSHSVVGDNQTKQHKGYWRTYKDWIKITTPHIMKLYGRFIDRVYSV
jgi:hypothetical protein